MTNGRADLIVIDYQEWWENHEDVCDINNEGSAGNMEVEGMKQIFNYNIKKHNVRYINYITDGDTKIYKAIVDDQPYGSGVKVEKRECVGHVQKRMGTQLRKLKDSMKGKKLSDGKTLGGKNRLTDAAINTLTVYYGNATRLKN